MAGQIPKKRQADIEENFGMRLDSEDSSKGLVGASGHGFFTRRLAMEGMWPCYKAARFSPAASVMGWPIRFSVKTPWIAWRAVPTRSGTGWAGSRAF